jgi:HEAT repeat protein
MQALARATRSFALYDPGNALVRQFLSEYREQTRAALDACGELRVEVRPFELAMGGTVLYQDTDRERSLPFRLFRDGVRRFTFKPSVPWEELLTLLEILAIRYTSLRLQEEDAVTLLRKAEFTGIGIEAVTGFVPAEANPEPELEDLVRASHRQPPANWDVPMPRLPGPVALQWREVPAETLAALRREASIESVAPTVLSLARDLLAEAVHAAWPKPNRELTQFFIEIRDFLLAEGQLAPLRQLLEVVGSMGENEIRDEVLRGLADARALALVLESLPEGAAQLPPDVAALAPLLDVEAILDRLVAESSGARRPLLIQLLAALLPQRVEVVLARLPSLEPTLADELVRVIGARAPRRALDAGRQLLEHPDERLRLLGLTAIEMAPGSVPLAPLVKLLGARSEALRVRAAEVLGRKGDETVIDPVRQALENASGLSLREADALGRALAELAPLPAARLFAGWLEPKGRFLRGLTDEQKAQQWAAVAGLGVLPAALHDRQLAALAEGSDGELRKHCLGALAARRRARGHG